MSCLGILRVEPDSSFLNFLSAVKQSNGASLVFEKAGDSLLAWLVLKSEIIGGLSTSVFVYSAWPMFYLWFWTGVTLGVLFLIAWWKPFLQIWLQGGIALFFLVQIGLGAMAFFRLPANEPLCSSLTLKGSFEEIVPLIGENTAWASPSAFRWMGILFPQTRLETSAKEAGCSPSIWRESERKQRYEIAIFSGAAQECRPLIEHLLESSDWQLRLVTPYATVFVRRGATNPPIWLSEKKAEERYLSSKDLAFYFSRVGTRLADLHQYGEARRFFLRAIDLRPESADIQSLYASFLAGRSQWAEAVEHAEIALKKNPEYVPALQVLVQAELAVLGKERGWGYAKRLRAVCGEDPFSVYLYARAANVVGAFGEEERALNELVELAEKHSQPTGAYRLLLGQAYAKQGFAEPALRSIQKALESQELTVEQTLSARNLLDTIRANQ